MLLTTSKMASGGVLLGLFEEEGVEIVQDGDF